MNIILIITEVITIELINHSIVNPPESLLFFFLMEGNTHWGKKHDTVFHQNFKLLEEKFIWLPDSFVYRISVYD